MAKDEMADEDPKEIEEGVRVRDGLQIEREVRKSAFLAISPDSKYTRISISSTGHKTGNRDPIFVEREEASLANAETPATAPDEPRPAGARAATSKALRLFGFGRKAAGNPSSHPSSEE